MYLTCSSFRCWHFLITIMRPTVTSTATIVAETTPPRKQETNTKRLLIPTQYVLQPTDINEIEHGSHWHFSQNKKTYLCHLLPAATKLGQGNVFTGVCDSVNRGGVCLSACWDTPPEGGTSPGRKHPPQEGGTPWEGGTPPEGGTPRHTVNERPVRILLECILVLQMHLESQQLRYLPIYIILECELSVENPGGRVPIGWSSLIAYFGLLQLDVAQQHNSSSFPDSSDVTSKKNYDKHYAFTKIA